MGTKKLGLLLAVLVSFSISLPPRFNSIIIVCAFILFLYVTIIGRVISKEFLKLPTTLILSVLFLISIIGLFYTSDRIQGWLDLERSAFLIAFIVIAYQIKNLSLSVFNLIIAFIVGCMSITLYALGSVLFILKDNQLINILELGHSYFADSVFIHPVYLSIYFIFIFFFLLETIRTKKAALGNLSRVGIGVALIFIVGILFFLRAQMCLLIFSMLLVMYGIIILKRRAWLVTFVLFTVMLLVFLLDKDRATTFFDTYGKNVSSALDQRFSVWRGTIEGIMTAPIFGAGTGGEQQLINEGYAQTGYQEGIDNSYNAHNQYLQFMARNGILELGCFLALLVYSFRQSLKMSNYTFLMFNMTVTLIMFTESFLSVQRGIVFFYFFLCAFIYLPYESIPETQKHV